MPFIAMPLGNAVERSALPNGNYLVRIEDAILVDAKEKPGQINTRIRLSVPDHPEAKPIFHYLVGFGPEDDEDKQQIKINQATAFMKALNVPYSDDGFELEDLFGCEGYVNLRQDDFEGRIGNKLSLDW